MRIGLAIVLLFAAAPAGAQRRDRALDLGSPWPDRSGPTAPDDAPDEAPRPTPPDEAPRPTPPEETEPQAIVALGPSPSVGGGAHHFEDGRDAELPWPAPIEAVRPLGGPHFVAELAGGFLAPLVEAQPFVQLVLGVEAFTGILRIRGLVGCAYEEVVESPPRAFSAPPARQGGVYPMVRFALGGDATPWLGIRVAVGTGITIWNDVRPTADGALEVFARLTDERRLELGVSGGASMRFVARTIGGDFYDWTPEPAARMALFVGGVL